MHSPPLANNLQPKNPQVSKVPAQEPSWLLGQPEDPFDAGALHPEGSPLYMTGNKINGGPYANHDWHSQGLLIHRHPFFLFGATKADE